MEFVFWFGGMFVVLLSMELLLFQLAVCSGNHSQ